MPSDLPKNPNRVWGKEKQTRTKERVTDPVWKKKPKERASVISGWSRQARIGVASLLFLALTGMLIWASLWLLPPKNACLVLLGAGYEDNLDIPHNHYGWNGLLGLEELTRDTNATFLWGSKILRLHQAPKHLQVGDDWSSNLTDFREKTIVICLSMHGAVDSHGPFLLPQNARAGLSRDDRLYLTTILERLKQLPKEKNKILLLDPTILRSDWSLGVLNNDFARALKRLDAEIEEVPNLVVMCSSDVDQQSWIDFPQRQTIFTHQVIEGLRGAASDKNNDGRINALELFEFVSPSVQRWVRDNRDADQKPMLLPQKTGQARARLMDLTVVQNYEAPEAAAPMSEFPKEIVSVWERYANLAGQSPAPPILSPKNWRLYQAIVLRYEQLYLAGDTEDAAKLNDRLTSLEQEIMREQRLELSSFQNSLAMPEVAGVSASASDETIAEFTQLWDASPLEYSKRWADLRKSKSGATQTQLRMLRLQFYRFLLERAQKNPSEALVKACKLVHVVDDASSTAPIEIHYMLLLERDRPRVTGPTPEYFALLQTALRVQVLSEQTALAVKSDTYSYSSQVYPWIRDLVEQADHDRRLGQDLLFASDAASWKKAGDFLAKAETGYRSASGRADAVRVALGVRDRVMASLPAYSHWVANRHILEETPEQKASNSSMQKVEVLWKDTHRLAELLKIPRPEWIASAPPADERVPKPRSLIDQAQIVKASFEALDAEFMHHCRDLANVDLQSVWRETLDALRVPFDDHSLRGKMYLTLGRTAWRLANESQDRARNQAVDLDNTRPEWSKAHGVREGRMALAVLGQRTFDAFRGSEVDIENFQQVTHRVNTFSVESRWWESLNKAGEQIGWRWQDMPTEIERRMKKDDSLDLKTYQANLQAADLLARQIEASECDRLTEFPSRSYQLLLVENLLLWLDQRTLADHWFALDPESEPYYRVAGMLLVEDCLRLENSQQVSKLLQDIQAKLRQDGRLTFVGPDRLQWTTQQRFDYEYRLEPEKGAAVPFGYPVLWLEPGKQIEAVAPAGPTRLVREVGGKETPAPIACSLRSALAAEAEQDSSTNRVPRVDKSEATMLGRFRGQIIRRQTDIDLFRLPNSVWMRLPPPALGSIAVRAPKAVQDRFGASNAAIAIVLDCSGSMGPPQGAKFDANTKYSEATRALEQVLGKLPKGTTVSLWVFGQAMGPGKTELVAEKTVERILAPVRWSPENPDQLRKLMERVRHPAIEPWNESPIMRTILSAKEDLAKASGFKTLLVLTDGMDNRFDKDEKFNPEKKSIQETILRTFRDSGIMLNVIGFKVVDEEEKQARQQFEVVARLPLPGRFYTVNDSLALVTALDSAMRQSLHYWIDDADNIPVPGMPATGLDVSRIGENAQWFPKGLASGGYKARVRTDRRLATDCALERGDLLLLDLVADNSSLRFARGIYSKSDYPYKPWLATKDQTWRLAVLQNQKIGEQALQMLVTLEKTPDRRETVLQMLKPRAAWIEVAPTAKNPNPYCQRWGVQAGYPAPAWSIDVPQWPIALSADAGRGLAPPELRVWWNPDQETKISTSLERRANDFRKIEDIVDRTTQVEGDKIQIDSVRVENHLVETQPGLRASRSCLVVRIQHAPGKPVWSQVTGLSPLGHEHRFYTDANASTSLFWPVTLDAANSALQSLDLIALEPLKKDAEKRGFSLRLSTLSAPSGDDIRPQRPVTLP